MAASPEGKRVELTVSGRYRIRRKLGSGILGTVYLARDEVLGRVVALKLIRAERLDPGGLDDLQQEFRAIASLHHSQLARAYDFGYTEERRLPFYTREYIAGRPLAPGPPGPEHQASPRDFLKPFFDLLDALHYLHAHEILHLDIHAGNLIVADDTRRGTVLIDFGLAQLLRRSRSSSLLGGRSSVPPELLAEEPPCPATDLYAVGRLLHFRLTGHVEGDVRLPREIPGWGPRLTLELERIAAKALQVDPEQRFQSAAEFRQALSRPLGDPRKAPSPIEPGEVTVDREAELEAIERALRAGTRGKPALLWLVGPRGIGKSRLLTEARLRAQLRGLEVVEARFVQERVAEPTLLKALRAARQGCRRSPLWLKSLAAEHGGSTLERARRAAEAYFAGSGEPLVILLDDLELADRESRLLADQLLLECARRTTKDIPGRGLVLVAATSGAPPADFRLPGRRGLVRRLKPLSARDAKALLLTFLRPMESPTLWRP